MLSTPFVVVELIVKFSAGDEELLMVKIIYDNLINPDISLRLLYLTQISIPKLL